MEQQRTMQQHMQLMQQQEMQRRKSQERQKIQPPAAAVTEHKLERKEARQEKETRRQELKEMRSSEQVRTQTETQKKQSRQVKQDSAVNIPVKNYRSSRSRARREPSPPVDYPNADTSDDTDENMDVRLADYDNDANRSTRQRKSVQSFSKKTSVTRNYPGCVIA